MLKKNLKQNYIFLTLLIVLTVNLFLRIIFYKSHPLFWDETVYLGMGKYFLSFGQTGLFESIRPPLFPLFLGLLWKIFSVKTTIFLAVVMEIVASLGIIILVYWLGEKLSRGAGLIGAILLSLCPTFFYYGNFMLSSLPSVFLVLISFWVLIKKKNYFLSGLLLGAGFLTRFTQALIFPLVFFYILFNKNDKDSFYKSEQVKKAGVYLAGFLILIVPYFLINWIVYANPFYSVNLASLVANNDILSQNPQNFFYLTGLIKEMPLVIFSLVSLFFMFKIGKDQKKEEKKLTRKLTGKKLTGLLLMIGVLFLFYFSLIKHQETRLLLIVLPYFALTSSYGIIKLGQLLRLKSGKVRTIMATLLILLCLPIQITSWTKINYDFKEPNPELVNYLKDNPQLAKTLIWSSSPRYLLWGGKAEELIYYPIFTQQRIKELREKLRKEEPYLIIISSQDMWCLPQDEKCEAEKKSFIQELEENQKFITVYNKTEKGAYQLIRKKR